MGLELNKSLSLDLPDTVMLEQIFLASMTKYLRVFMKKSVYGKLHNIWLLFEVIYICDIS